MKARILIISLFFTPLVASAETNWYGAISLGKTTSNPDLYEQVNGSKINYDVYGSNGEDSKAKQVFNLAAGYKLNKQFAAELEWQHRSWNNSYHQAELYSGDAESTHNALLLNGIYQLPLKNQVNVYLKASLGATHHSLKTTNASTDTASYNYPKQTNTTAAFGIGTGIKLDISKNLALGLEYRKINLGKVTSRNQAGSTLSFESNSNELTGNAYINF